MCSIKPNLIKHMRKSIITGLFFLAGFMTFAEPEIKGTASELVHYLNAIPKMVVITGEAEIRVPAHRAILSLRVITENKSL